ncbi:hypothetical protein M378DRAFT_89639 [Amanita muscaria Koide BX008]|uniref:Heme haloperoxidase family profile domain-containing protein n=1 Tax=Amanita muscaria (strain Koide BX008) TaxID=946122 RepID=A0A0C2SQD7_AMAMK|nr:hypothetical protein M378DRAFT_89639 [Amanita muscaria Koide BX008]
MSSPSSSSSNTTVAHIHSGGQCPVSGQHEYCPPQKNDSRSPCPALNAMANHGYIPRDGQKVSLLDLIGGLRSCYGLSLPLAIMLSVGGFFLLKRIKPISLYHIGKHDAIEHNASLVHEDCQKDHKYASVKVVPRLVDALTHEESHKPSLLDIKELAKFRVLREKECAVVDGFHGVLARGEMAIVFGIWGERTDSNHGVPKTWLKDWFLDGRLPKDWKPCRKQGIFDTIRLSAELKAHMEETKTGSTVTPNK